MVLAILWLDLSNAVADASILLEAQSGLMKGDYSVIDYSMQCGSFDVGVSLPAACSSAASSVVPALVVAAFCLLLSVMECRLRYLLLESRNGILLDLCLFSLTLDCFSWIQNGCLVRLMATVGCVRAAAIFVVTSQFIVDLFSSAAAFGGLFNEMTVLGAGAAAAAIVIVHALSSLDESAAGHALFFLDESAAEAKNDVFIVCLVQAAAAWVAATVTVHSVRESSSLIFFLLALAPGFLCGCVYRFPVCGKNKETSVY